MKDNDKILAKDLIKISGVSELLTGDRFALRLDRSFGKHEGSVNRLFNIVQDWIDSDKSFASELSTPIKEVVREFKAEPIEMKSSVKFEPRIVKGDYKTDSDKSNKPPKFATDNIVMHTIKTESEEFQVTATGQTYLKTVPLGMNMINIIGQKLHKHYAEEIYYIRNPNKKGNNVAVLHSEKEVKEFIRKEIIK